MAERSEAPQDPKPVARAKKTEAADAQAQPAGSGAAEGGQVAATTGGDGQVEVILSQFWTNPDTGENYKPGDPVTVSEDRARSLQIAGYTQRVTQGEQDQPQQAQPAGTEPGQPGTQQQ